MSDLICKTMSKILLEWEGCWQTWSIKRVWELTLVFALHGQFLCLVKIRKQVEWATRVSSNHYNDKGPILWKDTEQLQWNFNGFHLHKMQRTCSRRRLAKSKVLLNPERLTTEKKVWSKISPTGIIFSNVKCCDQWRTFLEKFQSLLRKHLAMFLFCNPREFQHHVP